MNNWLPFDRQNPPNCACPVFLKNKDIGFARKGSLMENFMASRVTHYMLIPELPDGDWKACIDEKPPGDVPLIIPAEESIGGIRLAFYDPERYYWYLSMFEGYRGIAWEEQVKYWYPFPTEPPEGEQLAPNMWRPLDEVIAGWKK